MGTKTASVFLAQSPGRHYDENNKNDLMQPPHVWIGTLKYMTYLFLGLYALYKDPS